MWFDKSHLEFANNITERTRSKSLRKDITSLIRWANEEEAQNACIQMMTHNMKIDLNMLCALMKIKTSLCAIWIVLWLSQWMIVGKEYVRPISSNSQQKERSSKVVQYSTSVLERDTMFLFYHCFRHFPVFRENRNGRSTGPKSDRLVQSNF